MSANHYKNFSTQIEKVLENSNINNFESTVKKYVELMKQKNIFSIVDMNKFITKNNLWAYFSEIQRLNTFESGFKSIGISKSAYSSITKLYKTTDKIQSHLIISTKMYQETLAFD